jgi:hypothetical protein
VELFSEFPGLSVINKHLLDYKALHEMFNAWLVIAVEKAEVEKKKGEEKKFQYGR